jgi:hypothetical protein
MNRLLDILLKKADSDADWIITRLRAIEDKSIGPRFPSGQFTIYNPHDEGVIAEKARAAYAS